MAAAAAVLFTGAAVTTGVFFASGPANAQISVPSVTPFSFADLVEAVSPAVVSIRVRSEVASQVTGPGGGQFEFEFPDLPQGHPLERFFREFQDQFGNQQNEEGRPQRPRFAQAVGSGFIISADGFVVTNNHVISEADEVIVIMDDGEERTATVVGADERTDLALLKIESATALPYVEFSDEEARVGDWVVAVGNPFGLGGTVTAGIVSARGRDIDANAYDDFIQIDAAVNRGNSGGPAFNVSGQVVGVNTAIFSPNGGSIGIAFAIPAVTVKAVIEDLMDDGSVTRGFLGVSIQDVTDDIAASVGLAEARGSLVTEPRPDSPAQKAGILSGDVILKINGEPIDDSRDLSRTIAAMDPGSVVEITLWRDNAEANISVTLAELSDEVALSQESAAEKPEPAKPEPQATSTGLTLVPNEDGDGAVIAEIDPDSIAAEKGFQTGDVILEANNTQISSAAEFEAAVEAVLDGGRTTILVKVNRGGEVRFVGLPLSAS
ncbi:MAG: Do family serine endopeptidase [Cucumibacter sp.]